MDPTTLMMLLEHLKQQGQMPGQMPPMQGQMPPAPAAQWMSFAPQGRGQFIPPSPQAPPPPQQGGGMFGGGKFGIGQAIAAGLNGYLAGTRGPGQEAAMQNLQMMALLRQKQMERQQSIDDYNRKRTDDNADWMTQYNYKLAHPEDKASEFDQNAIAGGYKPGTPEWTALHRQRADEQADPIVNTIQYGPMLRSQALKMGLGGQVGPQIGDIVDDPRKQGGPAPQAPGTFPY